MFTNTRSNKIISASQDGSPPAHKGRRARHLAAWLTPLALLGGVATLSAGCSTSSTTPKAATAVAPTVHEYMTILTGGMIKRKGWPKFAPSDITVPKGATVVLTIVSYDDGAAPLPSGMTYNNVTGGTETVDGKAVTTVANSNLSHTFTIASLGLNAPIPVSPGAGANGELQPTTVVFTFKATKSGTFTFQCMAPCGSGPSGMGGAMMTNGYMKGTLTVA
ncbi:MAG: hypothetical protein M0008_06425 [Actinomycetota bacterium]|nr:hypothetical protein [Actinomycetota bacterium]